MTYASGYPIAMQSAVAIPAYTKDRKNCSENFESESEKFAKSQVKVSSDGVNRLGRSDSDVRTSVRTGTRKKRISHRTPGLRSPYGAKRAAARPGLDRPPRHRLAHEPWISAKRASNFSWSFGLSSGLKKCNLS